MNVPTSFFTVATCGVEAYGALIEFGTETCKLKLLFLNAPQCRNSEEGGWYIQNQSIEA